VRYRPTTSTTSTLSSARPIAQAASRPSGGRHQALDEDDGTQSTAARAKDVPHFFNSYQALRPLTISQPNPNRAEQGSPSQSSRDHYPRDPRRVVVAARNRDKGNDEAKAPTAGVRARPRRHTGARVAEAVAKHPGLRTIRELHTQGSLAVPIPAGVPGTRTPCGTGSSSADKGTSLRTATSRPFTIYYPTAGPVTSPRPHDRSQLQDVASTPRTNRASTQRRWRRLRDAPVTSSRHDRTPSSTHRTSRGRQRLELFLSGRRTRLRRTRADRLRIIDVPIRATPKATPDTDAVKTRVP